ncbi:hypothetical protein F5J12DRAFT_838323 [Pisolithus orientalis]|uniref:Uncharacterized protein n=1 Tax=Pisolithus tinctorius Marx 270 TaxID=870435 RepID=A0A0C3NMH0_PISTI|nr:uncharacterized protein F5J12DRAFT_838323 [Pisolithus orientalis]KAI6003506.1 hypothetical protein F5J12DRAFT_838323 [Pisolithus orientalis]KAI6141995.1 hypothetical protein BKA82DRAFT_1006710 [Pisolithus tinctorius]KIN96533.1 hypothetical protein M404DRAFT_1006710 [Pisolithus tinctorius Marx 270]
MQSFFYAVLLLPVFLTIESTRLAFWASLVSSSPPPSFVPSPLVLFLHAVWGTVVWVVWMLMAWVLWVPVRAILWIWGIGRDGAYKRASAAATARWYDAKRQRAREDASFSASASPLKSNKLSWYIY